MQFADMRVFVVEDEALVAMNLEDMLRDLGCTVAGTAMQVEQAERMLSGGLACDVAILDVNLGGDMVYPLAGRLRREGVPIVFATGYGQEGLPEEWRDHAILQKPYTDDQVAEALMRAAGGNAETVAGP